MSDYTEKPVPNEPEHVQCEFCLAELPVAQSIAEEGEEYIQHFCGLECLERWRTRKPGHLRTNSRST